MPAWRREKYYQKEQYKQLGNITKKNNINNQEILPKITIKTIRKYYQKNNKNNQEILPKITINIIRKNRLITFVK